MTATAQLATPSVDTDLLYELRDGIARITFNRPQARNAFTFAMYERLAEICREANDDRSIKAMILTGAGDKAFAAGTDIIQFRAFKTPEDALDYEARIDRVLGALERCRVPTIAAIAGACTGGGAGIAACCDLRIAHRRRAKFGFPIARTLGNCLSMSNYRAPRGPDRPGARQGHDLHRAPGRGARRPRDRARERGGRGRGATLQPRADELAAHDRRPRAADAAARRRKRCGACSRACRAMRART